MANARRSKLVLRRAKGDGAVAFDEGTKILVVGDDPDDIELIARLIETTGCSVTRVEGLDEALRMLISATPPYTAVVSDFLRGGVSSSLKLLDSVRHDDNLSETPVMFLTDSANQRGYAWESGADAFLIRPFHANDLIDTFQATLGRSPAERAQHRREQQRAAS